MITDFCTSLHEVTLHQEGGRKVLLRCEKGADHTGQNHRGWLKGWRTDEETGRLVVS